MDSLVPSVCSLAPIADCVPVTQNRQISSAPWQTEAPHVHFLTGATVQIELQVFGSRCARLIIPSSSRRAHEAPVIPSAYSQIFEKGSRGLNLSVNSWIKSWQGSAFLLTVAHVLKPEERKEASPWSEAPESSFHLEAFCRVWLLNHLRAWTHCQSCLCFSSNRWDRDYRLLPQGLVFSKASGF